MPVLGLLFSFPGHLSQSIHPDLSLCTPDNVSQVIPAHRVVLTAVSSKLGKLCDAGGRVVIRNIKFGILHKLILLIYDGRVELEGREEMNDIRDGLDMLKVEGKVVEKSDVNENSDNLEVKPRNTELPSHNFLKPQTSKQKQFTPKSGGLAEAAIEASSHSPGPVQRWNKWQKADTRNAKIGGRAVRVDQLKELQEKGETKIPSSNSNPNKRGGEAPHVAYGNDTKSLKMGKRSSDKDIHANINGTSDDSRFKPVDKDSETDKEDIIDLELCSTQFPPFTPIKTWPLPQPVQGFGTPIKFKGKTEEELMKLSEDDQTEYLLYISQKAALNSQAQGWQL